MPNPEIRYSIHEGNYTVVDGREGWKYNLECPVEGLRKGWADRVIATYRHIKDRRIQQGYFAAIQHLVNEFQPAAYSRSLPVFRFEYQLREVIRTLLCSEVAKEDRRDLLVALANSEDFEGLHFWPMNPPEQAWVTKRRSDGKLFSGSTPEEAIRAFLKGDENANA